MDYPEDELAKRRAATSSPSRIPSQYEYEMREWQEYQRQIRDVESAPLSERKEACAEFLEAMRDRPEVVGERVGWILDGNYGKGAYDVAWRVMGMSARANKAANLTHMVGALEWRCPARGAIAGWKKLTKDEKAALDRAVKAEIKSAQEDRDRE